MKTRLQLQSELEELLGSRNVYYQPPENLKIVYPAIVYSKSNIEKTNADNKGYLLSNKYEIIVIDKKPDNPVVQKLLSFTLCSYNRHYVSDNLNHDVLTLYF